MYKSYYFLNRYIIELKEHLTGKTILEIFSQEKDKLMVHLKDHEEQFLEISVNPGFPYFSLTEKFKRAKRNTLSLFNQLRNAIIRDVLIASDDRIILISTSKGNLYFAIRGQFTNVFVIRDGDIESFKKENEDNLDKFYHEFQEKVYLNIFNEIEGEDLEYDSIDQIRKRYPFIGKDISNEVKLRSNGNRKDAEILIDVLKVIKKNKSAVFLDDDLGSYNIGFDGLKISLGSNKEIFDNIIFAFNSFLSKKNYFDQKSNKENLIISYIHKELQKLSDKLNRLQTIVKKGSNYDEYNKIAQLLLINLNTLKSGESSIELKDVYNNDKIIRIKLDPKLSPNQNADYYFNKAKDSRTNYEKSLKLKNEAEKYFDKLKSIEEKLSGSTTLDELDKIMSELKIKSHQNKNDKEEISIKFKQYLVDNKYRVYVGKDSTNNDLLTTKFAKQNDFWFHARSVSGSHVVLKVENTKEPIPKSILKKVAALAAFHSKAKTSGLAPVAYTLKKYVIKRKGMPVGQVSLLKEDVLMVKPEIPTGCEFIS